MDLDPLTLARPYLDKQFIQGLITNYTNTEIQLQTFLV